MALLKGSRLAALSMALVSVCNNVGGIYGQKFDESDYLMKVFEETRGLKWKTKDGWAQSSNVCDWYGVTCFDSDEQGDRRNHVATLDLSDNKLVGTLPKEIFQLKYMKSLVLRDNPDLFVSFDGVEVAENLAHLTLSNTKISSLEGIDKIQSTLTELHITDCEIGGNFPHELYHLTRLERLFANFNGFTGEIPTKIGNLKRLEELFLYENNLSGEIPSEIGQLTDLRVLAMANNAFSGSLPVELNKLVNLEVIAIQREEGEVQGDGITGPLLDFDQATKLTEVYFQNQRLSGEISYDFLKRAPKDEPMVVNLKDNNLTGHVPGSLYHHENMKLYLKGNKFETMSSRLCNNERWMNGHVKEYNCDAILCPVGTYSEEDGRAQTSDCKDCASATFMGTDECEDETQEQRDILNEFFKAMGGESWREQSGWGTDDDECDFYGITCNQDDQVTRIELANNKLTGTPPESIFMLPELILLDLGQNFINFKFKGINQAKKLEVLELYSTGLSSLENIDELEDTPIETLILSSNGLSGHIPKSLFKNKNLAHLALSYNSFDGSIPTEIGELTELKTFHAYSNKLTGEIPTEIENVGSTLRELVLSENDLTGELPSALSSMTRLEELSIHQTTNTKGGLTGPVPSFSDCERLTIIHLASNSLSGDLPTNLLENSIRLDTRIDIDLSSNKITGDVHHEFARFKKLNIDLSDNQITHVSSSLCDKNEWQDGDVEDYGCDAILCPKEFYNDYGRRGSSNPCLSCTDDNFNDFMGSIKCSDTEKMDTRSILTKFYYSMDGPHWKKNDGWLTSVNICDEWFGIECEDGKVTKIDLEKNNLSGRNSPQLFKLENLKELYLQSNAISFQFDGIEDATNLRTLYLSETTTKDLTGIGNAKSLEDLHLTGNEMTGSIPDEIFELTNLNTLFLNYNRFSGRLSSKVSKLKNLKELYLLANELEGQIPAAIGDLKKLEILALTENKFGGTLPGELNDLEQIKILAIQHEAAADTDAATVAGSGNKAGAGIHGPLLSFNKLENLSELYLGGNSLTGTIPYDFLDSVENKDEPLTVDLISNKLEGQVPPSLTQFEKMNLYVSGNRFSGIAPGLCQKNSWMNGEVESYDCKALMCEPNTYAKYGRQTDDDTKCMDCDQGLTSKYYGSFECLSSEDQGTESEILILELLYKALGGSSWSINSNWMDTDVSICQWKGITCLSESSESVQSINLASNSLQGEVPPEIFLLPNLEELNLENNEIKFQDLSSISQAKKLKYLSIDAIGLTSFTGIEKAPSLTLIHARYNNFQGTFPTEILSLTNLEVLNLSNNHMGSQLPSEILNLPELVYLECENCMLQGAVPSWIGDLAKLEYIGLQGNSLTGQIPSNLLSQGKLEHIDLSDQTSRGGTGLSGELPSFSSQPNLFELFLNKNSFSGPIPTDFLNIEKKDDVAIKIDLRHNKISGSVPLEPFTGISDLTLLLANNEINDISTTDCEDPNSESKSWNEGDVGDFGCKGFLCPIGSYNILGRQTSDIECLPCDKTNYAMFLGSTDCGENIQKDTLSAVFVALNGPDWKNNGGWMAVDDVCEWFGVTCEEKEVTAVNLDYNNLKGTVPVEVYDLPSLKSLSLKGNDIVMNFGNIEKAQKLEALRLSETGLILLDGISKSTSLKSLHLTGNKINNIPDEIYSMSSLEGLYMNYNEISGQISPKIGQLTKLEDLFLFNNLITGPIPKEIGNLKKLKYLAIGENRMSGAIPSEISNLSNLEVIALQREGGGSEAGIGGPLTSKTDEEKGKGFTGNLPSFDTMPNLRELYLGSNSFDGIIPSSFLQGVQDKSTEFILDLTLNDLIGKIPKELQSFSQMKIYAAGNQIDSIPSELCTKADWMTGEGTNGNCDDILCAPGTANPFGRQVNDDTPCETCPFSYTAEFYGSISCSPDENKYTDREILRMFYEQTGGTGWEEADNWMEDEISICEWHGVHCASEDEEDADDVVTRLHLPSNKLSGTVPPILFALPNLEMLNLRDNLVTVEMHNVASANGLTELYLDSTRTSSMNGISKAKNLVTLHVQENNYAGNPIPDELFDLTKLRHLYISDSNIGGSLPSSIGKLTALEEFYCHGNEITGEIPSEIGDMKNLESLVLSENRLFGTLPETVEKLSNLESLFIDSFTRPGAGLSGTLPDFSSFPKLRDIYLGENSFTGTISPNFLKGLDDFQQTVTIGLKSNQLTGSLPKELKRFHKLNIDLADNMISSIDSELCKKENWMGGGVGKFKCNAILCPQGTFNEYGRQSSDKNSCTVCGGDDSGSYLGKIMCDTEEKRIEREILSLFYRNCGGENWKKNENWLNPDVDICHWYGISCHKGKTVDSVLLGANNIIGTPPEQLFRMTNLKWLWLYSNPIEFSFKGIGEAKHLTSLLLDSTGLKSLAGIGDATRLTDLDVRFNSLAGPLTDEINNLVSLESLSLSNNKFDGKIPSFRNLKNLKSLRMGDNSFDGNLPAFETHSKLKSLDLSGNRLTGNIPDKLLESKSVEDTIFIDLSSNQLTGSVPGALNRFDKVTIYLKDNYLEGIDPSLCDNSSWNDGDVANFACDGILCAKGTYAGGTGRATKEGAQCLPCEVSKFYGQSECVDMLSMRGSASFVFYSSSNLISALVAVMSTIWIAL